jgi:hypothetical protein
VKIGEKVTIERQTLVNSVRTVRGERSLRMNLALVVRSAPNKKDTIPAFVMEVGDTTKIKTTFSVEGVNTKSLRDRIVYNT